MGESRKSGWCKGRVNRCVPQSASRNSRRLQHAPSAIQHHVHPCLKIGLAFSTMVCVSCAHTPASLEALSPNFDERRPNFVIIHYTSDDTAEQALATLTSATSKVSAHYLIARDGIVYPLVPESRRAWHAGDSYWGGNRDMNSASIGIELDNNGSEAFSEPLLSSLLLLLVDLQQRYSIPTANFLGHSDVAPRRKVDPGRWFPWQRLAAVGFGLWCEPPYARAPVGSDPYLMLAAIGYDVTVPDAALAAFKLHFAPQAAASFTDDDGALLFCLASAKLQSGNH